MKELEFNPENGFYVCIYSGLSGSIQLLFDTITQIEFYGDAGLDVFDALSSSEGEACIYKTKHLLKYISMVGLTKMKIRCTNKPVRAIVNTLL